MDSGYHPQSHSRRSFASSSGVRFFLSGTLLNGRRNCLADCLLITRQSRSLSQRSLHNDAQSPAIFANVIFALNRQGIVTASAKRSERHSSSLTRASAIPFCITRLYSRPYHKNRLRERRTNENAADCQQICALPERIPFGLILRKDKEWSGHESGCSFQGILLSRLTKGLSRCTSDRCAQRAGEDAVQRKQGLAL